MKLKTIKPIKENVLTREQALTICPDYVAFVEGDFDKFDAVFSQFEHVTKGREAITALEQDGVQTYIRGTISAVINDDFRAVDGPVVRFSGGGYTWRIDGAKYAFLLPKGLKACRHAVDTVLAGAV